MAELQPGDKVQAHYKTGKYIGEIMEDRGHAYLVKVLAVLKHPQQGDLHNPGKTENVFFHERKALAHNEKANISKSSLSEHDGEIPNYQDSLREALDKLKQKLAAKDDEFSEKAQHQLAELEKRYFK
ncbi:kinase-associated lipoprotein B [Pontibacillus marinus]|uniref:Kinase n=1 Tax=Pontibacillus marinus BH030004 = DSM 16465 TaxID=1385511 RepID=A0A0A5G9I2_9BACI|nr:kinase-associated lipoprotein B [Pontibacillus marinus]KGX89811.1 kinase [Pontibacillus marinus BH030004 = DSM 16465]